MARPVRDAIVRSGWTCPGRLVSAATPVSRSPTHSQLARCQRASASAPRSWRSTHSAFGRMPRTQPPSPVAASRSASSRPERVSSQVIARRTGRPSAAAVTSVGPCPSIPIASDLDRRRRCQQLRGHRPDRRPPVLGILLGGPGGRVGVERIGGPRQPEQPPVEPDQPGLRLGRPEIDREDGATGHPGTVGETRVRRAGLGHRPPGDRDERSPGPEPRPEPARHRPLAKSPGQAVVDADPVGQQLERRPQGPGVQRRGQRTEQRVERPERRREDRPGQLAGSRRDPDRAARTELRRQVVLERLVIDRQARFGHPERAADRSGLGVEAPPRGSVERPDPGVVGDDRRVDERGVDPQPELRVARVVGRRAAHGAGERVADRAADPAVELVQAADLGPGLGGRPVDDREVAPQRAAEPAPGVGPEVAVLVDALGDQRMGDLHEQRPRSGPEQQRRLAVEPPGHAVGAVQAERVVRSAVDPRRPARAAICRH